MTAPRPSARYFVSYSRRAAEDGQLAEFLRDGLEQAGHEVFIDRGMQVGTDWVEEITHRIDWCDYLVILLSEASVHSEMVLGEVRMAHRKRRRDGRPHILPIRVGYEGPLDYELDSYLARYQYARWDSRSDSARILQKIINAIAHEHHDLDPDPPAAHRDTQVDPVRPEPSFAADALRGPGGVIKSDDRFYILRKADRILEEVARRRGETVAIQATRQMGGSSLLGHYLAGCVQSGKQIALINLDFLSDADLEDKKVVLSFIARQLFKSINLDIQRDVRICNTFDLTSLIEDAILSHVRGPLSIAFDELDRVVGLPYQRDFFSMLRLWHNRRADPLSMWEDVDLAFVVRQELHTLIGGADRSPFNIAIPIEAGPFDRTALDELSTRYGVPLLPHEADELYELLGGHPYLTRLALYRLVTGQVRCFEDLYTAADRPDGPFGDHLRAMLMRLQEKGLVAAMRQAVLGRVLTDDAKCVYLHAEGLVVRHGFQVIPSNLLYARFFKRLG